MNKFYIVIFLSIVISSCNNSEDDTPSANQSPNVPYIINPIQIGDITWGDKNLNVDTFSNGQNIEFAEDSSEFAFLGVQGKAAWCYPYFDEAFGRVYGRLYNWYAVNSVSGLAPDGWRVATREDWQNLYDHAVNEIENDYQNESIELRSYLQPVQGLDMLVNPYFVNLNSAVAYSLKSRDVWIEGSYIFDFPNKMYEVSLGPGIDLFGFNIIPIGLVTQDGPYFDRNNATGYQWASFWTSTESTVDGEEDFARYARVNAVNEVIGLGVGDRLNKAVGLSVRIVKE